MQIYIMEHDYNESQTFNNIRYLGQTGSQWAFMTVSQWATHKALFYSRLTTFDRWGRRHQPPPPQNPLAGKIRFANWSPLAFGLGSLLTYLPHGSGKDSRQTHQQYNCWLKIYVVVHTYFRKYDTPQYTVRVYWRLSSTHNDSRKH